VEKPQFLAAVCYELHGEKDLALDKYRKAYDGGRQEIEKRLSKLADTKKAGIIGAGALIGALGVTTGGIGLLAVIGAAAAGRRKISEITDKAVVFFKEKEIQEINEFLENFLTPLSEVLSRRERKQIPE
jgi:hypothetical protein